MKLNGWQRIGIVASVIWALLGAFLAEYILYSLTYGSFDTCRHSTTSLPICAQNLNRDLANAEVWRWGIYLARCRPPRLSEGFCYFTKTRQALEGF